MTTAEGKAKLGALHTVHGRETKAVRSARSLAWFTLCSFQSEHTTAHMQERGYSLWRHTGTGISLVAQVQETVFSGL